LKRFNETTAKIFLNIKNSLSATTMAESFKDNKDNKGFEVPTEFSSKMFKDNWTAFSQNTHVQYSAHLAVCIHSFVQYFIKIKYFLN
jgi:hypothetical protein